MSLRPFEGPDLEHLPSLQPEGWGDITPHYRSYLDRSYCFPFKLMRDNRMCAVGTAVLFGPSAWLGHIIVSPDYRRQGLGLTLVTSLLDFMEDRHIKTVSLIATDMGAPVYRKAGFSEVTEYVFFKDDRSEPRIDPLNDCISAFDMTRKEALYDMDLRITGESRAALLSAYLPEAQMYIRNNNLEGCYFPTLGEGFILAETEEAGEALLRLKAARGGRCTLPSGNRHGLSLMNILGYPEVSRAFRMRRGKPLDHNLNRVYSRIGGNLG